MSNATDGDAAPVGGIFRVVHFAARVLGITIAIVGLYVAGLGILDETLMRVGTFGIAGVLLLLTSMALRPSGGSLRHFGLLVDVVDTVNGLARLAAADDAESRRAGRLMVAITGAWVSGSNSVDAASSSSSRLRAASITMHCRPRQSPSVGSWFSRA